MTDNSFEVKFVPLETILEQKKQKYDQREKDYEEAMQASLDSYRKYMTKKLYREKAFPEEVYPKQIVADLTKLQSYMFQTTLTTETICRLANVPIDYLYPHIDNPHKWHTVSGELEKVCAVVGCNLEDVANVTDITKEN